ncbi:MAG: hypothetical protein ACI8TV_000696, partial [Porticoccaceae bacterium]
ENSIGGMRKSAGKKIAIMHSAVMIRNLSIRLLYIINTVICQKGLSLGQNVTTRISEEIRSPSNPSL